MGVRAVLIAALCGFGVLLAARPQPRPVVIRDVRVFDGVSVREHQSVVVWAGHVESMGPADTLVVPDDAAELRGGGGTLLPGLIDAHVHLDPLRTLQALRQALVLGVTTVVTPTSAGPAEATGFADVQVSDGSDVLEVMDDDGHHTPGSPLSTPADFGQLLTNRNALVIPRLSVLYRRCGTSDAAAVLSDAAVEPHVRPEFRPGLQRPPPARNRSCRGVREAVRQLGAADAVVLAGTDAPFPGTTYGASLHWELEHLVEAGMTPTAALRAATAAAADALQMPDRGRIAPGLRADLVLVNGDATSQIRNTRHIVAVWKRGVRVQRTR